MEIYFDEQGTSASLAATLERMQHHEGILLLGGVENDYTPEQVNPHLQRSPIPIIGGLFPEIIYDDLHTSRGLLALGLPVRPDVLLVESLSDKEADFGSVLDAFAEEVEVHPTTLVFVDGFASRIGDFLRDIFEVFGLESHFIGGGAGRLTMESSPCIFHHSGLHQDAALLAGLKVASGVGVAHGWTHLEGPFRVTSVKQNTILELDHQPAFEVYAKALAAHGVMIEKERFFETAKTYPFGLDRYTQERVVRDPVVVTDDGALVCVGEIEPESIVHVLQGSIPSLLTAAAESLEKARAAAPVNATQRLFFDCISRVLYMQEEFAQELQAVGGKEGDIIIGALTIGEIANSGFEFLEFYNKTCVMGLLAL